MRVLHDVEPTPEQLTVMKAYQPGCVLIRGAAGSGKTTTAVLRLRVVAKLWKRRQLRNESDEPVRILVLTYNKTLRGYVEELVLDKVTTEDFDLTLDTFAHWAWEHLGRPRVVSNYAREKKVEQLALGLGLPTDFIVDEVDYVLGRFEHDRLEDYADRTKTDTYERRGRGTVPQMQQPLRRRLLDDVIYPYRAWLSARDEIDWNDASVAMATRDPLFEYDIVVVDEAQDFSANQVRAIMHHTHDLSSTTFVLDAVQRIYPRGFDWVEAGVSIARSHRLERNFRNTRQIAEFALPLVRDLPLEDDGTLPEFENNEREDGRIPDVVEGLFNEQMDWVIKRIGEIPEDESVALLQARGGTWMSYPRQRLVAAGYPFVDMTRLPEWPQGKEEIAICTLHSSKGLEFDHVIVLGLSAELMPHGPEDNDTQLATHRRLVAMGIGRARKSVAVTYKPGEESKVIQLLDATTYDLVRL